MAKNFSRSDVTSLSDKMTNGTYAPYSPGRSNAPASPVAAKVMRESGISREKMQQAYSIAQKAVYKK